MSRAVTHYRGHTQRLRARLLLAQNGRTLKRKIFTLGETISRRRPQRRRSLFALLQSSFSPCVPLFTKENTVSKTSRVEPPSGNANLDVWVVDILHRKGNYSRSKRYQPLIGIQRFGSRPPIRAKYLTGAFRGGALRKLVRRNPDGLDRDGGRPPPFRGITQGYTSVSTYTPRAARSAAIQPIGRAKKRDKFSTSSRYPGKAGSLNSGLISTMAFGFPSPR